MIKIIRSFVRSSLVVSGNLVLCCLLGLTVESKGVTIDPTTFSPNADISSATSGVVLSAPGNSFGAAVYAVPFNSTSTTGDYFGYQSSATPDYRTDFAQANPLRADFSSPIATVSVTFALDGSTGWMAELRAFDSSNILLGSLTNPGSFTGTITASGISYILAYFSPGRFSPDEAGITLIEFGTAAATPDGGGTLALLGMAVVALCLVRQPRILAPVPRRRV